MTLVGELKLMFHLFLLQLHHSLCHLFLTSVVFSTPTKARLILPQGGTEESNNVDTIHVSSIHLTSTVSGFTKS